LSDDRGVAGDVLSDMVGEQPRPTIIERSGLTTNDEPYALSLIKWGLCMERWAKEQIRCKEEE
jgi:hypothetical protein